MDYPFEPLRFAAIVYDDGVAVDHLMATFARELRDAGTLATGLIQLPPEERGSGPCSPISLRDIGSGAVMPICQDLGPGATSCKLDACALAAASARLRVLTDEPSELLIISKFSKQEVAGRGFRSEFAHAIEQGHTVLTSVKRELVHNWLDFTGDLGTLLDCRLWVLRDWWQEVRPRTRLVPPQSLDLVSPH